jgi:hypothetical protein
VNASMARRIRCAESLSATGMLSDISFCRRLRLWRGGRAVVSSIADERELDQVIVHKRN